MIQVDLPGAFAVGQIYGLLARDYLKKEPEIFTNKLTGPMNLYLSCGYIPAGMYLLIAYPSWETMYVTNWVEQTFNKPPVAAFYILFMVGMILLGNLGFMLAHYWYRKGKDKFVIAGSIIGVVLTILPFLLRWGVWWKIGTYAQFTADEGLYSFWKPPFIIGWLCFMGYWAVVTVLVGLWFKNKGAKL